MKVKPILSGAHILYVCEYIVFALISSCTSQERLLLLYRHYTLIPTNKQKSRVKYNTSLCIHYSSLYTDVVFFLFWKIGERARHSLALDINKCPAVFMRALDDL